MIRVGHVFVGAIFPIAEALLVNAVSDAMNGTAPYIMALVVVGIVHAILFFALLFVETPLPQLLVELDDQAQELRRVRTEEQTYKADNATLMGAVTAVQVSLISLEDMRSRPERDLEKLFERVLFPWVVDRSALFGFESDALHNFAVYLRSETDESLLEVRYRVHDDRISPTNRIWRSGDGHVGTCFLRKEMIFFSDEEMDGAGEYAVTSQPRPEDKDYYRSMMATPLLVGEEARGVFIITSSLPGQFVRELHGPILDVVGGLLAQTLESHEASGSEDGQNKV